MKSKAWLSRIGNFFLGVSLLSISPPLAGNVSAEVEATFSLNNGYRVDHLDWNIAGDIGGNNPNIISELTWSDINIYQIKADGKAIVAKMFYLRSSLGYGLIDQGKNQDSDFDFDNRTHEFSRSNNSADIGNVMDASVGVGYQFRPELGRFGLRITPLVGYSFHKQNLKITNGNQTISEPSIRFGITPPAVGPFSGLDSSYDAKWKGPWTGIDLSFEWWRKFSFFASFEYHWADYEAEADWNLRSDFAHPKSFEHNAAGKGILVSIGGNYSFTKQWLINASVDFQDWSTQAGTHETFFAKGTTGVTRLNEVNWGSYASMLGITYRF